MADDKSTAVELAKNSIYKVLNSDATLQAFKAAWPDGEINPQKIATQAFSVIARKPDLLQCEPKSLVATIVEGTLLGLSFLPHLKQAAIVPFKDKDGKKKAQLIPEYMGLVKLASNSGVLHYVDAHVVHEKDQFDYELGFEPILRHRPPKTGERGKAIGVYAVGKLKNGETVFRYLTREDVEFYKKKSKAGDDGPWVTDEMAMWRKTAIRRLVGYLPMDEKTARAAMIDELADTGHSQPLAPEIFGGGDFIEAEVVEPKKSKTETMKEKLRTAKPAPEKTEPEPEPEPDTPDEKRAVPPDEIVETDIIETRFRESVIAKLRILYVNKAEQDLAVSEATGGKFQSVAALSEAPMPVLQTVEDHLKKVDL
jgi:recombination protein RecT